jgi:hypothetical protein
VEILKSKEHESQVGNMKWFITRDREGDSIAGMNQIISAHDVDCFHPEEEDGDLLCMANSCEVAIGSVNGRIRLLMNRIEGSGRCKWNALQLGKVEIPFPGRCRYSM